MVVSEKVTVSLTPDELRQVVSDYLIKRGYKPKAGGKVTVTMTPEELHQIVYEHITSEECAYS